MDWSLPLDTFYSIFGVDYHDYHVQIFKKNDHQAHVYILVLASCLQVMFGKGMQGCKSYNTEDMGR
jgi:hypothetical protein